jgi:zinc transport system permease protein
MIEIFQYEFMRNAFLAALLVSLACGVVGTFVVIRKIVFLTDGIAHAAFGGIGLGYLLGIDPVLSALPFSIGTALGIGTLSKKIKISEDSAIGILFALGMALGIIFIGLAPGYAPDLFSYLFGSILTVPVFDLFIMLILDISILIIVIALFKELQATSFDEEFSEIAGVPTKAMHLLFLCLVALSVIVLIRAVGIILIMALLTLPTLIAKQWTQSLKKLMISSFAIAAALTFLGLWISYWLNLASGATIVLVLIAAFLLFTFLKRYLSHRIEIPQVES